MNHCRKCHILFEDDRCPRCGNRYVYAPEGEDFCYLTEKEFPWSEVLEQALKDANIPVVTNDAVAGAWMTSRLGVRFERSRLFVPYAHLDRAREIMDEMFDGEGPLPEGQWSGEDERP